MKPKQQDKASIWKYICLKPTCKALFDRPQKYCRVCKSDVVEIAKKEKEPTDG